MDDWPKQINGLLGRYTQPELAAYFRVSPTLIGLWGKGRRQPSKKSLRRYPKVLAAITAGMSPEELRDEELRDTGTVVAESLALNQELAELKAEFKEEIAGLRKLILERLPVPSLVRQKAGPRKKRAG